MKQYKGILLLLASALFFSLSTVFAKIVNNNSLIPGIEISFFRFLMGLIGVSVFILYRGESIRPRKLSFVMLRALFNTVAVLFFFTGIQLTTVTNANMLNMSYPVFVFLAAPLINKEKSPLINYIFLVLTLIGVYLIAVPDFQEINPGDLFSFLSAIIAGLAISVLREARKYDNSIVILFYLMLIGSIISFFVMLPFFILPQGMLIIFILLSALMAVLGQVSITVGYRYIDAASDSLVSASRILFASVLGISLFSDPLSFNIVLGGICILISLIGVSGFFRRKKKRQMIIDG